jgi:HD superfamily phosphohydrolase
METTRKILARLSHQASIGAEDRRMAVCAALLHDLGHGPFSHVFERVTGVSHEDITRRIILSEQTDINRVLRRADAALPEQVAGLLKHEQTSGCGVLMSSVISGQLDADRMDYLLRDDHMTGAGYGRFDLSWLLTSLVVDEKRQRLAVSYKGISAVEGFLQARFHMYRNVYFHKVVRSAEGMLKLALQRARRLAVQDRLPWPGREHVVLKALVGMEMPVEEFIDMDDVSLLQCFKAWTTGDDEVLGRLCRGLLDRKLYKTIELPLEWEAAKAAAALAEAVDEVRKLGGDPDYDLFYDEPTNTPYEAFGEEDPSGAAEIYVRLSDQSTARLTDCSSFARALIGKLSFRRIHIWDNWRDAVVSRLKR